MLNKFYTGGELLLHIRLCRVVLPAVFFLSVFASDRAHAQRNDDYAYEVFETLLRTINRSTPGKPVLVVENNAKLIASTYADGQIKIGYQLIDHCRSFGADSATALAHILSHELMHYYNNHLWGNVVGSSYADEQWGLELSKIGADTVTIQLHETQADIYAMYYAFSAGYATYRIAGRVLDSTYAWYQLKEKLKGYPSKSARKEIAADAAKDIESLIPAFESANLLLQIATMYSGEEMLGILSIATYSLQAILDKNIHTKEMYNNLAIAEILQALAYADNDTLLNLHWPLINETETILYSMGGTRGNTGGDNSETVKELLNHAVTLLDKAIYADNAFYPAYINKSIALLLLKKLGSCSDVLDEVQSILPDNRKFLYEEISGLGYLLKGKTDLAKEAMQTAEQNGSKTALLNLEIFYNPSLVIAPALIIGTDTSTAIGGEYIGAFMDSHGASRMNRFDLAAGFASIFYDTIPGGILFDIRPKPGVLPFRYIRIISFTDAQSATDKGIRNGSSEQQVIKAYGQPYAIRYNAGELVYCYPANNLLIRLKNGKVTVFYHWWAK